MADGDLSRLTEVKKVALAAVLKPVVDEDRYPLSPRKISRGPSRNPGISPYRSAISISSGLPGVR